MQLASLEVGIKVWVENSKGINNAADSNPSVSAVISFTHNIIGTSHAKIRQKSLGFRRA